MSDAWVLERKGSGAATEEVVELLAKDKMHFIDHGYKGYMGPRR